MKPWIRKALLATSLVMGGLVGMPAQAVVPTAAQLQALVTGGQVYLLNRFVVSPTDATMGSWGNLPETEGAVAALLDTGKYSDPLYKAAIDKAVKWIMTFSKPLPTGNGGLYQNNDTYENGLGLVALSLYGEQTGGSAALNKVIDDAMSYAVNGTATGGGWGYVKNDSGADMSNTQFGAMGLYYGSRYRHVTIDPNVNGWSKDFYAFLKNNAQAADGHFYYYVPGHSDYTNLSMTGGGLWSLAMIAEGNSTEATKAITWFATDGTSHLSGAWAGHDYYLLYAVSKALAATLGPANKLGGATGTMWADDLSTALLAQVTAGTSGGTAAIPNAAENHWSDNNWLSGHPTLATSFMLQALAFTNASTEVVTKILVEDPVSPPVVPGLVTLQTSGGVTITAAVRGNAAARGGKATTVKLPLEAFDFTLNHVPVGGTADLKLSVPNGALDPTNANGFLNANGTLKANIKWYKISGGLWNGSSVPIVIDTAAKTITVTLRDGGPEDADHTANGTIVDPGAPGFDVAPDVPGGGGGCAMGLDGPADPTFPLLVAAALAYLVRRRRA